MAASDRVTAMMVDDCLHDPVLAAKVLLYPYITRIQPHLELRLHAMWRRKFFIDSSGFGTGKSLSIAMVAMLRCLLMRGREQGIVSLSYAQGQLVYQYLDRWVDECPIVAAEVMGSTHKSEAREMTFRNGGRIRVIPPGFSMDAQRGGSEDWHDAYFDEWTKYPKLDLFIRQFWTRMRKPVRDYDATDPVFDRHMYMSGTGQYQWHPAHAQVELFGREIETGNRQYELQSWNYTHVPQEYADLIEMDGIRLLERSLAPDKVEQEIMGRWTKDSTAFYSRAAIVACRTADCPAISSRE